MEDIYDLEITQVSSASKQINGTEETDA